MSFLFLVLAVRRRFEFLLTILLTLTALGIFNAFVSQSILGLPLILFCGFLAYLLVRWKSHRWN